MANSTQEVLSNSLRNVDFTLVSKLGSEPMTLSLQWSVACASVSGLGQRVASLECMRCLDGSCHRHLHSHPQLVQDNTWAVNLGA